MVEKTEGQRASAEDGVQEKQYGDSKQLEECSHPRLLVGNFDEHLILREYYTKNHQKSSRERKAICSSAAVVK
jgi:hypothetical protein